MDRNDRNAIIRATQVMVVALAGLLAAFWLPEIDLSSPFSRIVVQWTNTGDVLGIVVISLALIALRVTRAQRTWRRRLSELAAHILLLFVLLGGGICVNEYVIKPSLAVPRPNIVWLAEHDALAMAPEQFYSSLDKLERRHYLQELLTDTDFDTVALNESVQSHWIHETGYSFPSGHAFAAMLSATYFLAMGMSLIADRRRFTFYVLPVWALLVAWSRVLLRVHRPEDILIGGLLGAMLGLLAYRLAQRLTIN